MQFLEMELVNESVPKDYGTQTDTHPWICQWDRESLGNRYSPLTFKRYKGHYLIHLFKLQETGATKGADALHAD